MTSFTQTPNRIRRGLFVATTLALAVGGVIACTDRTPTATDKAPETLPVTMALSPHGLTMAIGDTLTLTPTVTALSGAPITDLTGISFTSLAPKKVTVSATGTLTAVDSTDVPVKVAAKLQRNFSTVVDTILLIITPTRLSPLTFIMEPDSFDGTVLGIGYTTDIVAYAVTPAGDTLWNIPVGFTTSSTKAHINIYGTTPYFSSQAFGQVSAYGSASIYGTTYSDSLTYTITYPDEAYFVWDGNGNDWYYPPSLQVVLKPGGHVYWSNFWSTNSTPITFDDPTLASAYQDGDSGNIPAFQGQLVYRQFNTPGTIKWHSGTQTGTIIVQPTDSPPGT